jgi:DNA-binding CsgD family transcriptional regulator/tetratricopeptide (TPR) repeat protein
VYGAPILVCRDYELRIIEERLAATRSGHGSTTFIVGDGGIGKSRLTAAAAELGAAAEMCVLRGRGRSIGPMTPFRLLTEALLSLERSVDRIDIGRLGPYQPVLARLVPGWGTPAPIHEDTGSLVILSEAVLRLTGLAGEERGCLVILDDLHNADAESLAVIDYLSENLAEVPAMLVCAASTGPSPAMDLARSASQRGTATLLELRRLDRDEVRVLAAHCLGCAESDIPAPLAEHLWADSGGVPLLVSEFLNDLIRSGVLSRDGRDGDWQVTGRLRSRVTGSLTRNMAARLDRLGPEGQDVLLIAAVIGMRFPVSVLSAATGMEYRDLIRTLHTQSIADVIVPDEETPDWYAFQHPLVIESLLSLLAPDQRLLLAGRAADAVEASFPGMPGEWCQTVAMLRLQAGDRVGAGALFTEAGRRALAEGAASTAVSLLDKAIELLDGGHDAQAHADALATLLLALSEAGMVERAVAEMAGLDRFVGLVGRQSRAQVHTRVAWAAAVAGRTADGLAQLEIARQLLGPGAADADIAPVTIVAAHLALDQPGADQVRVAEQLARRAAGIAEDASLPVVACQAWQLLGALSRTHDPAEATASLEHALSLAVRYKLPIEKIHAQIRLGNDEALREGSITRLDRVRQEASRVGAVTAQLQAEVSLAFQAILRGDFDVAERLLDQVIESTSRLRLIETSRYALLNRATLAAHRGRRADMEAGFADLRRHAPEHAQHLPRAHGLARAWCALLEEDRQLAMAEQARAVAAEIQSPTVFPLTGRFGLHLLLQALDGRLDRAEFEAVTAAPVSQLRWDRQFAFFASATLLGREGRHRDAAAAVAEAVDAGSMYPGGRNLGLRLVAEAAIADGWGRPAEWLRAAEAHFHSVQVSAVASSCRSLMRQVGVKPSQRRLGHDGIPAVLRATGVTVREYEVFQLLTHNLGNREIGNRLHLSPRTVEKHVAALLAKTGMSNRAALCELARRTLRD